MIEASIKVNCALFLPVLIAHLCVGVAQNAHIFIHLCCTSLWSPHPLVRCICLCERLQLRVNDFVLSVCALYIYVYCVLWSFDLRILCICMCVCVYVYVCALHRSVLMRVCILPRPPTLWLARRVWNLPPSLLLCLPGRRIFWSIIFHDCYIIVFDNIFVMLQGQQLDDVPTISVLPKLILESKFERGHQGFSF